MPADTKSPYEARVDPAASGKPDGEGQGPSEAWHAAWSHVAELREYASHYAQAKADAIKVTLRNAGVYAAIGIIGMLVACTITITAAVLLCMGIAHAIGRLMGNQMWAGELVTAVLILGAIAVGVLVVLNKIKTGWRKTTFKQYEHRHEKQRAHFGHDVEEQARR
jgi:hypothetical protein